MKINKIIVDGFKPFKDRKEFTFSNGINMILGRNGRGKSSIKDVVDILLYDKVVDKFESKVNLKKKDKEFYIAIDFDHHGHNYFVDLTHKDGKNERYLYIDGNKEFEAKGEDVKKYLNTLFDAKIMQYALVSSQREAEIVECRDAERRELLKKVRNLDYSSKVANQIEPIIKQLGNQLIDIDKETYLLENKTYEIKDLIKQDIDEIEFKKLNVKLSVLNDEIEQLNVKKSLVHRLKIDKEAKEVEKTRLEKYCEDEKLSVESYEKNKQIAIDKLDKDITRIEHDIDSLQEQIANFNLNSKLNDYREEVNKEIIELEKNLNAKENEYASTINKQVKRVKKFNQSTLDDINTSLVEKNTQLRQKEKEIRDLQSGVCPTCGECVDQCKDETRRIDKEQIEKDIVELKVKKDEVLKEKEQLEKEEKENNELIDKKREYRDILDKLKVNLSNEKDKVETKIELKHERLEKELNELDKRLSDKQSDLKGVSKDKENTIDQANLKIKQSMDGISDMRESIKYLDEDIKEFALSIDNSLKDIKDLPSLLEDKESISSEIAKYNDTTSKNDTIKEDNERIQNQQKKDNETLENVKDKKLEINNKLLNYKTSKDILLKDFPNYVIDSKVDEIQYDMNSFIDDVYDKSLNVEFKKNKASIQLNYGEEGKKISVKNTSGAERKLIQLSFIHSFNKELELDCLILDEPDESSDNINAREMYKLLGNMSDEYGQLVIITHKEAMKEYLLTNYEVNVLEV